jgi:hypothetical protein
MIIDMTGGNWVDVQARMTSGGTANTSSLYFFGFTYITHAGGPSRSYTGSTTAMTIGGINDLGGINETLIANPALPKVTQGIFVGSNYGTNYNAMISGGFQHNVATAYDGIYIFPNSGTFTGEIKIYGIKD